MRLSWMPVVGAIGLAVSSLATAADSFTVGVLSCAAETDRDRRLDCYDRQVAGYTAGLARGGSAVAAAPAAKSGAAGPAASAPALTAATTGANPVAPASAASTAASNGATATAGKAGAATAAAPSAQRHYAGHIASIEHFPDYIVVHLDNQQTWKQVSESPGGNGLRTGDAVTIDKQLGSWWLAGPKGEAVQVSLEVPRS